LAEATAVPPETPGATTMALPAVEMLALVSESFWKPMTMRAMALFPVP
jgi:hypothetical protein